MPVVIGNAEYPDHIIEDLEKEYKVYKVDATEESRKLGNPRVFNLIVLGIAAQHMDFTKEQWYEVIERYNGYKRKNTRMEITNAGFNIDDTAIRLERIYLS